MSSLVVDASAALVLLRQEPGHSDVRHQLRDQALSGEPILVPSLFWLELVNVLARRHRYPPSTIVEAVYELEQVGIGTADVGRPSVLAVIDAVASSGLTAYDATYLVLAESTNARLLTADAALAAAAGDRAILVGGGGALAEEPMRYVAESSWACWEGAAAYLSELRRAL